MNPSDASRYHIRVRKKDSVFVYNVFESYEGVLSYSTLPHEPHDNHRDLELSVPAGMKRDYESLIRNLEHLVVELPET